MTHPASAPVIRDDAEALRVARGLAAGFAEGARERDRDRRLPHGEVAQSSATGLWAVTVPREHGGADVSAGTLAEVIATLAASDGSLGQIPQNHFYAIEVLRAGATQKQQRFFFGCALTGQRFGNALAEIGNRDFKRRTRLTRSSAGWRIDGQKFYCTGALYAHWIPTLVVAEDEVQYLAFVPCDAPGVTVTDDWDGFGQRTTGSGSVAFAAVPVEPDWVVPFGASFARPTSIGPIAQIMHAAIDLGIGRAALAATLDVLRHRARPWIDAGVDRAADDPLTLQGVGEVSLRLRAADALLRRAGRIVDAARAAPDEDSVARASIAVAEARILTTEAGLLAGTRLLEYGGASATGAEDGFDRHWRDVRTHTLHDPVRWKYQAVGRYHLTGERPPRHGAI